MEKTRWQRVHEIFTGIVELPVADQGAAIKRRCRGDLELEREVRALLQEDVRAHAMLDSSLEETARTVLQEWSIPDHVQKQIGRYRVLKLLGEGGMGVVYLAERTDIGGLVAIKLLRDAWLSPMRRQRFELEEATLAQLTHPAIARIYDANTLEDGTPFYVMEYVNGIPITEYCREYQCPVRERLRLFREVCEAVQYAHSHAIIHRDLKPSNILVGEDGLTKLLDFGIAKQLDANSEHKTVTNFRMLTPAYASPEQKSGAAVGVYSDVYALGVLLRELLTGESPANVGGASSVTPSLALKQKSSVWLDELTRTEWRDLDALSLKACEEQPERRYATVDALIRDLDCFRDARPLAAQPPRFGYTFSKFVARHRTSLVAFSAVLALMLGMAGFYTWRLAQARELALQQAARTRRIQQFTESLFDGGDKSAGPSKDLLVTDLLQRGRQEAANLSGDPEMRADMEETLGSIYYKLGKLDAAEPLLTSALQQRRKEANRDSEKLANVVSMLALLHKDQGNLDAAERGAREAIEIESRGRTTVGGSGIVALGRILNIRGKYDEAITDLRKGLPLQTQGSIGMADNLTELANAYFYKGDYPTSEKLNRQALGIYIKDVGSQHPLVADIHNNLGAIEMNRGDYTASEADYREAVAICEHWYGPNHPETAANLTALAQTLSNEKRDDEAEQLLMRALDIQKSSVGPVSSTVATTINQLGLLAFNRNQYPAARSYFTQAQNIWRQLYGENHQFVAVAYSNLGSVCLDEKNYPCAEQNYREAVRRLDHNAPGTFNAAVAHLKLGRALLREGRFAEAAPESEGAYAFLEKNASPTNRYIKAVRTDLAAIYEGLKQPTKAAEYRAELHADGSAGR